MQSLFSCNFKLYLRLPNYTLKMWKKTKHEADQPTEVYHSVVDGLKKIYDSKIKPLEELYQFDMFHSPTLNASDFDAKPMVLLLGQYSTGKAACIISCLSHAACSRFAYCVHAGKTSFIRYLLERDFPGCHIGMCSVARTVFHTHSPLVHLIFFCFFYYYRKTTTADNY